MTLTEKLTTALIVALVIGHYIAYRKGYSEGRRKGLHDGWVLGQGGKISPGLTPLEAWDMPLVHPDGWVYRDGKIEEKQ